MGDGLEISMGMDKVPNSLGPEPLNFKGGVKVTQWIMDFLF